MHVGACRTAVSRVIKKLGPDRTSGPFFLPESKSIAKALPYPCQSGSSKAPSIRLFSRPVSPATYADP